MCPYFALMDMDRRGLSPSVCNSCWYDGLCLECLHLATTELQYEHSTHVDVREGRTLAFIDTELGAEP
jgi:hypothetical protein